MKARWLFSEIPVSGHICSAMLLMVASSINIGQSTVSPRLECALWRPLRHDSVIHLTFHSRNCSPMKANSGTPDPSSSCESPELYAVSDYLFCLQAEAPPGALFSSFREATDSGSIGQVKLFEATSSKPVWD